ncbi:MFS transporter [Dyella sp. A6]|uniref:MFS transporter n=1 Tax=Dyella aluminiiresistens TaxID=3069105 RepID=UPI002E75A285|nr:MFS transporter [Dyella sp. A6]
MAALAIGMAEFIVVGILPAIATDMQVSLPRAGMIVSVYAVAVAVAAPLLTALTGRMDRRWLAAGLMGVFVVGNLVAYFAPDFATLLVSRALAGAVQGVFYSMATVVAASLVPKARAGEAIAIMFSGLTIALVSGVPLGAFITEAMGWRAAFLMVSVVGALAALVIMLFLPKNIERPAPAHIRDQFKVVLVPRLVLVFAITCIGYGGAFIAFTFLSDILQRVTGFSQNQVGAVLVAYGAAVTVGNMWCAKLADRKGAVPTIFGILAVLTLMLSLLSLVAPHPYAMVPVVMVWGAVAFGSIPVLQLYVVQQAKRLAPTSLDASSSMNISAFNAGIALGAWAGGIVVARSGVMATGPAAAAVVAVSVLLVLVSGWLDRRDCAAERARHGGRCADEVASAA